MNYSLKKIKLNLKTNWKISRNESLFKENYFLIGEKYSSEIAPNIRYGETNQIIEANFNAFCNNPSDPGKSWCPSFKNAVSNLKLKEKFDGDMEKALGLKLPTQIKTSFSIPIMKTSEIGEYLSLNPDFHSYKIKINQENGLNLIKEVSQHSRRPLRIDANEAFENLEDYKKFEDLVSNYNIEFIEQPFPATKTNLYLELKGKSKFEIIADESILDTFDKDEFPKLFDGINVKLMKAGGLCKAKTILEEAKSHGMKTMIGCMIESSLGICEASYLASLCDYIDLDGALLLENDPYQNLFKLEKGSLIPQF